MKFFITFVTLVAGMAIANPLAAENVDGEMAAQKCLVCWWNSHFILDDHLHGKLTEGLITEKRRQVQGKRLYGKGSAYFGCKTTDAHLELRVHAAASCASHKGPRS